MPSVNGNAALDVLVGLFFLYFLLSIVCSAINEAIAAGLNLRAKDLERGLRNLLDGEGSTANTDTFFSERRVRALFKPPGVIFRNERAPSYIPSRVFALTVLDTFTPPRAGVADDLDLIARARAAVGSIQNERLKGLLEDALNEASTDVASLRGALERSFDEVMDRASGWYKRRVQVILFAIALALVAIANVDSLATAQRLWKNDALRATVVAEANKAIQSGKAPCETAGNAGTRRSPTDAANKAADCVNEVRALGIPFGWSRATSPHSFRDGIGKVLGLLVTVFALSLGAPFWFDLLGKIANLRGSGQPAPGAEAKDTRAITGTPAP